MNRETWRGIFVGNKPRKWAGVDVTDTDFTAGLEELHVGIRNAEWDRLFFNVSEFPGCCGAAVVHDFVADPGMDSVGNIATAVKLIGLAAKEDGISLLTAILHRKTQRVWINAFLEAGWEPRNFKGVCTASPLVHLVVEVKDLKEPNEKKGKAHKERAKAPRNRQSRSRLGR